MLITAIVVSLFLLLPLLAIVPVSLTPSRMLTLPSGELSLMHYQNLLADPRWWQAAVLSFRVGLVSSTVSTILALAFALGLWMFRPRFAPVLVGFVLLPMIAPPVVSAMALYFLLTSVSAYGWPAMGYDSWGGLVVAHTVVCVPYAVVLILVSLSQVDRRIDLAARGLGASIWTRAIEIIIPNIRMGIFAAWLMSFALSWEEISATMFVTSVNTVTLPRLMWTGIRDNIDPAVAAVSVILIIIATAAITIRLLHEARAGRFART